MPPPSTHFSFTTCRQRCREKSPEATGAAIVHGVLRLRLASPLSAQDDGGERVRHSQHDSVKGTFEKTRATAMNAGNSGTDGMFTYFLFLSSRILHNRVRP